MSLRQCLRCQKMKREVKRGGICDQCRGEEPNWRDSRSPAAGGWRNPPVLVVAPARQKSLPPKPAERSSKPQVPTVHKPPAAASAQTKSPPLQRQRPHPAQVPARKPRGAAATAVPKPTRPPATTPQGTPMVRQSRLKPAAPVPLPEERGTVVETRSPRINIGLDFGTSSTKVCVRPGRSSRSAFWRIRSSNSARRGRMRVGRRYRCQAIGCRRFCTLSK